MFKKCIIYQQRIQSTTEYKNNFLCPTAHASTVEYTWCEIIVSVFITVYFIVWPEN